MKSRVLPILNLAGCLALTGLVLLQWNRERALDSRIGKLQTELAAARDQSAAETKRAAALHRDIEVLKESIEATQKAAEAAANGLAENESQTAELQMELGAAREQIVEWQTAIAARDEKLKSLNTELVATRKRLDEAIGKLKTAGAR